MMVIKGPCPHRSWQLHLAIFVLRNAFQRLQLQLFGQVDPADVGGVFGDPYYQSTIVAVHYSGLYIKHHQAMGTLGPTISKLRFENGIVHYHSGLSTILAIIIARGTLPVEWDRDCQASSNG